TVVLVGSDRLHRQRRAALHRRGVPRPRPRARPVERQWSALPGRGRPHHAPAEAGGADAARASPSGAALPARHGCHGPRLHGGVPDPSASACTPPGKIGAEGPRATPYRGGWTENSPRRKRRKRALLFRPSNAPAPWGGTAAPSPAAGGVGVFSPPPPRHKPVW